MFGAALERQAPRDDGRHPGRPSRQPEHRRASATGASPARQLLGFRGAPGNTINHTTSYWVPNHSPRVFVEAVDVVCGIGYDRAAELGPVASRFHEIRRVVSNLGVFDFGAPTPTASRRCDCVSVHPGVTVDEVVEATGFELVIPDDVPETRLPTDDELERARAPRSARNLRVGRGARAVTRRRSTAGRTAIAALVDPRRVTLFGVALPDRADGHGLGVGRPADRGHVAAGGLGILASATMTLDELRGRDRQGEGAHDEPVRREPAAEPARRGASAST